MGVLKVDLAWDDCRTEFADSCRVKIFWLQLKILVYLGKYGMF